MEVADPLTLEVGLDWRTAEIDHYREVRDLLGGAYFRCNSDNRCGDSDFWTEDKRNLGDRIDYDFTNTVDWFGGFVQSEYTEGPLSLYGMAGLSTIKYSYVNHFVDDGTGSPLSSETDNIMGFQVKGGGLYNVTDEIGLFANAGYVSKVPIFDNVIDDRAGIVNADPQNESFLSLETGADYRTADRKAGAKLNLYFTQWNDRTYTIFRTLDDGTDVLFNLKGLDARHMGVELEANYQPTDYLRLDAGASFANWKYTNDVRGTYRPDDRVQEVDTLSFYVKDLKVGDAPQSQLFYGASVFPYPGLYISFFGKTFDRHYADFDPFDRDDSTDRTQSWQAPGYTKFDLHVGYDAPRSWQMPAQVRLFANVFNVFDTRYIQDAVDNSAFNSFDQDHDADDAEVYFGLPRTINVGVQLRY
jgi:outer membrane receptor protein involved in Fe transport